MFIACRLQKKTARPLQPFLYRNKSDSKAPVSLAEKTLFYLHRLTTRRPLEHVNRMQKKGQTSLLVLEENCRQASEQQG